jgi:hypothetical protein
MDILKPCLLNIDFIGIRRNKHLPYNKIFKLFLICNLFFFSSKIFCQTNINTVDFETANAYTTSIVEFTDVASDFFIRTDGSNIASSYEVGNIQESYHMLPQGLESFYLNSEIYLEDLFTNEIIDLREQSNYSFQANVSDDNHRFKIHFYGVTDIEKIKNPKIKIYSNNNKVYVKMRNSGSEYKIIIFDILGREVLNKNIISQGHDTFLLDYKKGVFIVLLTYKNTIFTKNIVINL